jgi:hypothetical protein
MIQVNLIPNVKQEFIKAQRMRNLVISISIVVSIASVAVVVVMGMYVFGVQGFRNSQADKAIMKGVNDLKAVPDLDKALTVRNQLQNIDAIYDKTPLSARMFDVLATVTPSDENKVSLTKFDLNVVDKTIAIEGKTYNGYKALDAFKKTILATKFSFTDRNSKQNDEVPLTDEIIDGSMSFGEDESGQKVLSFSFSFTYAPELLSRSSTESKIIGPKKTNATDSALEIPKSIFEVSGGGDK